MSAHESLFDDRYPKPTHPTLRGRIERLLAPGFGWCFRCGRPWKFATEHQTPYRPEHGHRGCFPLCEACWGGLPVSKRLPYYDRLVSMWTAQHPAGAVEYDKSRDLIRTAVRDGR